MPVYKNKQRGTWYASFYYTDWDGKRRRKKKEGFRTRREAQQFEEEFKQKRAGETDMTFGALVDLYMADCETRLRRSTVYIKRGMLKNKILPIFGDIPVRDISPAMIRHWQNEMMSGPEGLSQSYLRNVNAQLSACFNYAVRFYGLEKNPVALCGFPGKGKPNEMQFWTREEFYKFIKFVKRTDLRVAFEILFWTGMRSGELLALTLNDIDFEKSTVRVSKTVVRPSPKGANIAPPKTAKGNRTIAIPHFLLKMIRSYADRLVDYEPADQLFTFSRGTLRLALVKGSEEAEVKRIRVHDLRHSHASMLIEMGYSPLLISERLGHEKIQTTLQTYSHLYPDKQVELANQIEENEAENYADFLSVYERNDTKKS